MKIAMIGDVGAGKTTFLTAAHCLMSRGLNGLHWRAGSSGQDKALIQACEDFCNGRNPAATSGVQEWDFDTYVDAEYAAKLIFVDVPGSKFRQEDTFEVEEIIRQCDAVMLFLNGQELAAGKDISTVTERMRLILNQAFRVEALPKAVLVTFTKYDAAEQNVTGDMLRDVTAPFCRSIAGMEDKIDVSRMITVCKNRCICNVDLVVGWLMQWACLRMYVSTREVLSAEQDLICEEWGEGMGRDILHFFGLDSRRRNAVQRSQRVQEQLPEFERLENILKKLIKFVDEYTLGEEYVAESGAFFD